MNNHIEYVESFYRSRHVWSPSDICLDDLAAAHNATILREPRRSHTLILEHNPKHVEYLCVVDTRKPPETQRVHAAHELAHVILHYGYQTRMFFLERMWQEAEARRLAGHIFAPTYMLLNYLEEAPPYYETSITYLAHVFGVKTEAMQERLRWFWYTYPLSKAQIAASEWGC